jgi:hypothetical protein
MFLEISKDYYINTDIIYSIEFTGKLLKINMINNKYYTILKKSRYYNSVITKLQLEDLPYYNPN